MFHWLLTVVQTYVLHSEHANGYEWWSGPGSDLGEAALIGAAFGAWRKVNCQAPRCLRFGHHPTADGMHKLCRKHHPGLPDRKLTLQEIHRRHHAATTHRPIAGDEIGITTDHDEGVW